MGKREEAESAFSNLLNQNNQTSLQASQTKSESFTAKLHKSSLAFLCTRAGGDGTGCSFERTIFDAKFLRVTGKKKLTLLENLVTPRI